MDNQRHTQTDVPPVRLGMGHIGSFGAKVRSYTVMGLSTLGSTGEQGTGTILSEEPDQPNRTASPTGFFSRPNLRRRSERHSFSVLSSPLYSTPPPPRSDSPLPSPTMNVVDGKPGEKSPKKTRRGSKFLNALSLSLTKTTLQPSARPTTASSSSAGNSSFEKQKRCRDDASSHHDEYHFEDDSNDDEIVLADDEDAFHHTHEYSHASSASAYQTTHDEQHQPSTPVLEEAKRIRKLSFDMLKRRWSRADMKADPPLSPPVVSKAIEGGSGEDDPDATPDFRPETPSAPTSARASFTLHSFRNVRRQGSTASYEPPSRYHLSPPTQDSALPQSTDSPDPQQPIDCHSPSQRCMSPASLNKPISPLASQPASPRRDSLSNAAAGGSGYMSAGRFMRSAARSRPDLRLERPLAHQDETNDQQLPSSPTGSAHRTPIGSPYRPMTPLGEGAKSPAEELAILEADLARAKTNSLAYLAQMEEENLRREHRQQRQNRQRHSSYSYDGRLGLSDGATATYSGHNGDRQSYFPPIVGSPDLQTHALHGSRPQSPRITSSELLLDKLARLEQQVMQGAQPPSDRLLSPSLSPQLPPKSR